jgi:hypothetical protein
MFATMAMGGGSRHDVRFSLSESAIARFGRCDSAHDLVAESAIAEWFPELG